jgi:hypothetical protein
MTDLTFCYLHMTRNDLLTLDTLDSVDYLGGDLSDDEMDIPLVMVPPNPEESDILPSRVHPSYPYGNPTTVDHPATTPRHPWNPHSRALFEDMGYGGGGVNGIARWNDLALEELLPIDEEKEEARRAAEARKMASGATGAGQQPPPPSQPHQLPATPSPPMDLAGTDTEDEGMDENDENDLDDEYDDEDEGDFGDEDG